MKKLSDAEMETVLHSYLFSGIDETELKIMLPCLAAERRVYARNEFIFRAGAHIHQVGLVLSGCADILRDDYWGSRHIVAPVLPGELFGESYAVSAGTVLGISVQASAETAVLFLDTDRILHVCASACSYHSRLIDNMVTLLASRNLSLNEKLTYITQPTLRDKLLCYLSAEAFRRQAAYFDIPFDRQQLADFLDADRSALSNELSKMKREGILDYQKNHFKLKTAARDLRRG